VSVIEPDTAVPDTLQGKHWIGLPYTREKWAEHRKLGKWGFILRACSTWGFFLIMGVINPVVALWIMGWDRGMAYAIPGFIGGTVGGIWISHVFWKKCEEAFAHDGIANTAQ
jgi:hypothetical protein